MAERIPQSVAIRVPLQAFLASDHFSPATGVTIAVTISKNGASYGNPSAGATNATEIANGSYYVDLSTTDTGTVGPLFVRGAVATMDPITIIYNVVAFVEQTGDCYTRLGAPTGASVSADVAATKALLPTALVGGRMDSSVGAMAANVITAAAINADAITDAKVAADVTIASVTGAVGSVAGNVVGSVASVTAGVTVATNNDKTGYALTSGERTAIANEVESQIIDEADAEKVLNAITDKIAAVNPDLGGLTVAAIASAVWSAVSRTLTAGTNIVLAKGVGVTGFNDIDAAGARAAVGLASANLDTQLDALPTNAELAAALGTADDAVLAQVALVKAKTDNLPSDPADQSLIIAATDAIMTRIGAAGAGLTALGDARLANLDAAISSRSTFAGGAVASVTGAVGSVTATVNADVVKVNGVTVDGAGTEAEPWGPA